MSRSATRRPPGWRATTRFSSPGANDGNGLYFYRARYYSPGLQFFIESDQRGFGGGDANL